MEDKKERIQLIDVLKLVSPGTILRTAIDDLLRAEMGALVVVYSEKMGGLMEGGFKVDSALTYQKIVELAKMDGAIVLSEDLKKILYANVLLIPDVSIKTDETGTRHKAAERIAKQAETLVIAISERRKKISVYHGNMKYILQNTSELLSRAAETLRILEKQREIFDELLSNLNILEISGLVVVSDICSILQRTGMITKIASIVDRYLIELGKEGTIIRMRMRELLKNIESEQEFISQDYGIGQEKVDVFTELGLDEMLDISSVAGILFSMPPEEKIKPKGYRILGKMSLNENEIGNLVDSFENLDNIINASHEQLKELFGDLAEVFQSDISNLKEQIMMGKKI